MATEWSMHVSSVVFWWFLIVPDDFCSVLFFCRFFWARTDRSRGPIRVVPLHFRKSHGVYGPDSEAEASESDEGTVRTNPEPGSWLFKQWYVLHCSSFSRQYLSICYPPSMNQLMNPLMTFNICSTYSGFFPCVRVESISMTIFTCMYLSQPKNCLYGSIWGYCHNCILLLNLCHSIWNIQECWPSASKSPHQLRMPYGPKDQKDGSILAAIGWGPTILTETRALDPKWLQSVNEYFTIIPSYPINQKMLV